jgi:hypothetical protein
MNIGIPKDYLLTIAVYGTMGDGTLPEIMRVWAQRECERAGLAQELRQLQKERLVELERRVRNVIGDDAANKLLGDIHKAAKIIKDNM